MMNTIPLTFRPALGDMRACTVDVIGDSHLRRMILSGERFPLEVALGQFARSGAGIRYLREVVEKREQDLLFRLPMQAELTVVFIGGNDLDTKFLDVPALAREYANLFNRLRLLSSEVVVLHQFPRPEARNAGGLEFWTNAVWFDHLLSTGPGRNFTMWKWGRRLRCHEEFYAPDGVHVRSSLQKRMLRHFCSAIFAGLRTLHRHQMREQEEYEDWCGAMERLEVA